MREVKVSKGFLEHELAKIQYTCMYVDSWVYKRACTTTHMYLYECEEYSAKAYFVDRKLKMIKYFLTSGELLKVYEVDE